MSLIVDLIEHSQSHQFDPLTDSSWPQRVSCEHRNSRHVRNSIQQSCATRMRGIYRLQTRAWTWLLHPLLISTQLITCADISSLWSGWDIELKTFELCVHRAL